MDENGKGPPRSVTTLGGSSDATHRYSSAGQDQLYSTAIFGETRFSVQNVGATAGRVQIRSWGGVGDGPFVDVAPGATQAHSGWYAGVPARVVNVGGAATSVTVTP